MVRYFMRSDNLEEVTSAFTDDANHDSDHIDSDIEEMLYTSIHHQTVNSCELSSSKLELDCLSSSLDSAQWPTCKIRNERNDIKINQLASTAKQNGWKHVFPNMPDPSTRKSDRKLLTNGIDFDISYGNDITLDGIDHIEQMKKFYTEDDYDSENERKKLKKMTKDRRYWKICPKDIALAFRQPQYSKVKQCKLCHEKNHIERDCPWKPKVCRICGESDHEYNLCPAKNFCSTCFTQGHMTKKCKAKDRCSLCKMVGHTNLDCTFHWRRFLTVTTAVDYHQMTQTTQIAGPVTVNKTVSCCNCGMTGSHFSHECNFLTMNYRRHEIPSPFINANVERNRRPKKSIANQPSSDYKRLEIYNDSSDEIESSLPEIDSDDSLDYVLNLLKQSTGETTSSSRLNGKTLKRKQYNSDINLNIKTNSKKRKVANQVKPSKKQKAKLVKGKKMTQFNDDSKIFQKSKSKKNVTCKSNKQTKKQTKSNVNHQQKKKKQANGINKLIS